MVSKHTLPETNIAPENMDGWNTSFPLGWPTFRCELLVSGSVFVFLYFVKSYFEESDFQFDLTYFSNGVGPKRSRLYY